MMEESQLLHAYAKAMDGFDFETVKGMFLAMESAPVYQVQMRANFERNGVLDLVRDTHPQLVARLDSHPFQELPSSRHLLGEIYLAPDGEARATFQIDRAGKPTFAGEYRARFERAETLRFKHLMVILDGESCPGAILVPI